MQLSRRRCQRSAWPMLLVLALVAGCVHNGSPGASTSPTMTATPAEAPTSAGVPTSAATPAAMPTLAVGPPTASRPSPSSVVVPAAGACHSSGGLPDPTCTPGLLNPDLTIAQLCAAGFSTRTVRPPDAYTNVLKRRIMAAYGLPIEPRTINGVSYSTEDFYELDHDIALEVGGHPWSPLNLWPEPRQKTIATREKAAVSTGLPGPWAEQKDIAETRARRAICADPGRSDEAEYAAQLRATLARAWPSLVAATDAAGTEPTKEAEP